MYRLNQIECPVALFYGAADPLPDFEVIILLTILFFFFILFYSC